MTQLTGSWEQNRVHVSAELERIARNQHEIRNVISERDLELEIKVMEKISEAKEERVKLGKAIEEMEKFIQRNQIILVKERTMRSLRALLIQALSAAIGSGAAIAGVYAMEHLSRR